MAKQVFPITNPEVVIEHEPKGLGGTGAITLQMGGVKFRWTLADAETIGEKLIKCVRLAEEHTARK